MTSTARTPALAEEPNAPTRPTTTPVAFGTAEQLARLAHFRGLEAHQPEELDAVAHFLLGDVGSPETRADLWTRLHEGDAHRLWYLISDDWDDRDLDELTAAQHERLGVRSADVEEQARYEHTRERLTHDIEHSIWLARYRAAEARRGGAA